MQDKFLKKYPEICKSAFIEHLTELQQKELFGILNKDFVRIKKHKELWKNMDTLLKSYMRGTGVIKEQKVKDALTKYPRNNSELCQEILKELKLK